MCLGGEKMRMVFQFELSFFLRLLDLQSYDPQLQRYKDTSASLTDWIEATRKKQDALQATKIDSIQALKDHINNQKVSWYCPQKIDKHVYSKLSVSCVLKWQTCNLFVLFCYEGIELRNQSQKGDGG